MAPASIPARPRDALLEIDAVSAEAVDVCAATVGLSAQGLGRDGLHPRSVGFREASA